MKRHKPGFLVMQDWMQRMLTSAFPRTSLSPKTDKRPLSFFKNKKTKTNWRSGHYSVYGKHVMQNFIFMYEVIFSLNICHKLWNIFDRGDLRSILSVRVARIVWFAHTWFVPAVNLKALYRTIHLLTGVIKTMLIGIVHYYHALSPASWVQIVKKRENQTSDRQTDRPIETLPLKKTFEYVDFWNSDPLNQYFYIFCNLGSFWFAHRLTLEVLLHQHQVAPLDVAQKLNWKPVCGAFTTPHTQFAKSQ